MRFLRRYRKPILILVFPAFLIMLGNSTLNMHNHMVKGYLWSHAHPFNKESSKTPYKSHLHTDFELLILDLLSKLEVLITYAFCITLLTLEAARIFAGTNTGSPVEQAVLLQCPRGPPVYSR